MTFDQAMTAIRNGGDYSLTGHTLVVNGITLTITHEEFDVAYAVMDEVDEIDDDVLRLP